MSESAGDAPVISALVVDELAYRSVLGWLTDGGDRDPISTYRRSTTDVMRQMRARLRRLWKALDELAVEIIITDTAVIDRARLYMAEPGLGPRDAFHAAHALEGGCDWIVSSDPDFDAVRELKRLGPGS
jgi:predicted nucleic acid-binding protein